jgi:glycosyltransferase involved in cell wall biosynthesis
MVAAFMRLLCVSNGPLPYHTPILNHVAKLADLHVVYMSKGHPLNSFTDLWGVEPEFPRSFYGSLALKLPRLDFRTQVSTGVSRVLRRLDPDVVFFSSWGPLVWEPVVWARFAGRGTVMWAESTATSGLVRGAISTSIRRAIVGSVDAFVTNGSLATEYLRGLGIAQQRIVTSTLPSYLPTVTTRLGDASSPAYLFVGRLIPRKRPADALAAFREVAERLPDATLTFVGDGPLEPELRSSVRELGGRVVFRGRVEGEQLATAYGEADVLLLPAAREVWGLVVNEALASGLFVVASEEVGSAHDLLTPRSGELVPVGAIAALAAAMLRAADADHGPEARKARVGSVAEVTPAAFAEDLLRAAEIALASTRRDQAA